jgi:hypothetical protein
MIQRGLKDASFGCSYENRAFGRITNNPIRRFAITSYFFDLSIII